MDQVQAGLTDEERKLLQDFLSLPFAHETVTVTGLGAPYKRMLAIDDALREARAIISDYRIHTGWRKELEAQIADMRAVLEKITELPDPRAYGILCYRCRAAGDENREIVHEGYCTVPIAQAALDRVKANRCG